jgi:hypothetical protein
MRTEKRAAAVRSKRHEGRDAAPRVVLRAIANASDARFFFLRDFSLAF